MPRLSTDHANLKSKQDNSLLFRSEFERNLASLSLRISKKRPKFLVLKKMVKTNVMS